MVVLSFGNAGEERAALEKTYEDTGTLCRTSPQRSTGNISLPVSEEIYTDFPCGISFSGSDNSGQTDVQNNISYTAVIFTSPKLQVLPGDMLILKRVGRDDPTSEIKLQFAVVGRPAVYATHQEIKVNESDVA